MTGERCHDGAACAPLLLSHPFFFSDSLSLSHTPLSLSLSLSRAVSLSLSLSLGRLPLALLRASAVSRGFGKRAKLLAGKQIESFPAVRLQSLCEMLSSVPLAAWLSAEKVRAG